MKGENPLYLSILIMQSYADLIPPGTEVLSGLPSHTPNHTPNRESKASIGRYYQLVKPPSIVQAAPVTKEAFSLSKKAMTSPISSGLAIRPNG